MRFNYTEQVFEVFNWDSLKPNKKYIILDLRYTDTFLKRHPGRNGWYNEVIANLGVWMYRAIVDSSGRITLIGVSPVHYSLCREWFDYIVAKEVS